ncbi:MAG: hypothetical protein IKO61_03165 [Lachnospiraceae bacterium]|nr:hypothetical protein [Lachnospiraceae bacterium]
MKHKTINKISRITALIVAFAVAFTFCVPVYKAKALSNINETFNPDTDYTKATAKDVGKAKTKKGIQGTEWRDKDSAVRDSNPDALNIDHVLLNLDMSQLFWTSSNATPGVNPDVYTDASGNTYKFHYYDYLIFYEWRIRELVDEGKTVTLVLVMQQNSDPGLQNLIYPGARGVQGVYFTALNVNDANARKQISAAFHYLARKFSYSQDFVENWIIGNEANVPTKYNHTGTKDKNINVDVCVKSFDILYQALKDESPYAKAYISLTHNWQNDNGGDGIPTKTFLDAFAAKEKGKKWNLAFHAYPPNMETSMLSKQAGSWLRHDSATSYICGVNLEQLTNYVKKTYGTTHRIILSEQSFDSKGIGEAEQAAMIAYTYYAGDRDSMVDAVIFSTWMDSTASIHEGHALGIVTSTGKHKQAYNVFKYMNQPGVTKYSDAALKTLGLSKWTDKITYSKKSATGTLKNVSINIGQLDISCVKAGLNATKSSSNIDVEYRWYVQKVGASNWTLIQNWTLNNELVSWTPSGYGNYTFRCDYRVVGNSSSAGKATCNFVLTKSTPYSVTEGSIFVQKLDKNGVTAGMTYKTNGSCDVEFKWIAKRAEDEEKGTWETISDWKLNNEWLNWTPKKYGTYTLCVQYRVPGNPSSTGQYMIEIEYHPHIKDKCMTYYTGPGGGYLIGFESYDNPNQSYKYEMFVMDLTLLANGSPSPWVHRTGAIRLAKGANPSDGKTMWTIWQPKYGYYLTLFRLYDKKGNIIDEVCYGFVNAY